MPSKKKKSSSPQKRKTVVRSPKVPNPVVQPTPPPVPVVQNWFLSNWTLVLLAAAAVSWLVCGAMHYPRAEKVLLIIAVLIGASYFLKLNNLKFCLPLVGLGWVLAAFALNADPNFSFAFPFLPGPTHLPDPFTQFALGMGLLVAFWRFLPPADPSDDISKGWARIWFWVIFAVAAYFRFYKIHEACGIYWDDCAVSITDARGILEFHERPFLMPIANREPFYCYFLATLWSFMPNAFAIFVHRLGGGLIDMVAIWLFYLVGKEAGGRRVGLVAAALGAVSKPMIIAAVSGNSHVTSSMAIALILLTTLRLFKKPDWKHFIYWALALGFSPYNYTSVRPWLLFIVTAVFLWIWFHGQKGPKTRADLVLGWGTLLAWAFCFLMVNNFLPKDSFWVAFLSHGWVGLLVLAGLGYLFFTTLGRSPEGGMPALIPKFFLGVALAALVIYPLATQPLIAAHASGLSIFHSHDSLAVHFGADSFKVLLEKIVDSMHTLFIGGEDRGDMNMVEDSFFDYFFIPALVLGLVSFLTRPDWMKGFFLVAGLVGVSPHILSIDPHSGKLSCCVAPLAVLAGLGAQQLYQALEKATSKRITTLIAVPVLVAYLGWATWGAQARALDTFFRGCRVEKTVSLQVQKFSSSSQVFIAGYPLFVSFVVQAVLDQGYDVYSLKDHNPIFLKDAESPRDAVVVFHYYDKATRDKITKDYKDAKFDVISLEGWKDSRPTFWRAIVPASEITENEGQLFYYRRVPGTNWRRDYLAGRYILGYGVIELQESTANLYQPIAPGTGGHMMNLKGSFNLPADSRVAFRVNTNDFVKFQVDGRQLFYLNPYWQLVPASKKLELSAGDHQVEYDIWLQHEQTIPKIMMSVNGGPETALGEVPEQASTLPSKP